MDVIRPDLAQLIGLLCVAGVMVLLVLGFAAWIAGRWFGG